MRVVRTISPGHITRYRNSAWGRIRARAANRPSSFELFRGVYMYAGRGRRRGLLVLSMWVGEMVATAYIGLIN